MSKDNNVNPDHYKLAGRERPGKGVALKFKAKSTEAEERERWTRRHTSEVGPKSEAGREKATQPPEAEDRETDDSQKADVDK
jgi:hypothetical protein